MAQKNWQFFRVAQYMARKAAEDQFARAAMTISAHNHQVGAFLRRGV
jgi:hypothetical protein